MANILVGSEQEGDREKTEREKQFLSNDREFRKALDTYPSLCSMHPNTMKLKRELWKTKKCPRLHSHA